jgi:hypothetical protein
LHGTLDLRYSTEEEVVSRWLKEAKLRAKRFVEVERRTQMINSNGRPRRGRQRKSLGNSSDSFNSNCESSNEHGNITCNSSSVNLLHNVTSVISPNQTLDCNRPLPPHLDSGSCDKSNGQLTPMDALGQLVSNCFEEETNETANPHLKLKRSTISVNTNQLHVQRVPEQTRLLELCASDIRSINQIDSNANLKVPSSVSNNYSRFRNTSNNYYAIENGGYSTSSQPHEYLSSSISSSLSSLNSYGWPSDNELMQLNDFPPLQELTEIHDLTEVQPILQ